MAGFDIKFDSESQRRRSSNQGSCSSPAAIHIRNMTPEILRLLATDMKTIDISKQVKVTQSSINNVARRNGIDMTARLRRIQANKPTVSRAAKVGTILPETLTQDGVSLKWLSMKW